MSKEPLSIDQCNDKAICHGCGGKALVHGGSAPGRHRLVCRTCGLASLDFDELELVLLDWVQIQSAVGTIRANLAPVRDAQKNFQRYQDSLPKQTPEVIRSVS